jgi:hypothetical protein
MRFVDDEQIPDHFNRRRGDVRAFQKIKRDHMNAWRRPDVQPCRKAADRAQEPPRIHGVGLNRE